MLKKNHILMFIMLFVFMFCGISDVNAKDNRFNGMKDSDMTCVFDKFTFDYAAYASGYLLITSKKGGKLEAYFNTSSGDLNDKNWVTLDKSPVSDLYGAVENDVLDSDGYFKSCPKYFYKFDLSPLTAPLPGDFFSTAARTVHYVNQNPNDYLWNELLRDSKYVGLKEEKYEYFHDINSSVEISVTSPSKSAVTKADLQSGKVSLNRPTPDGYTSCLFARCSSDDSCENILQMDFNKDDLKFYLNLDGKSLPTNSTFTAADLAKQGYPGCPPELYVELNNDFTGRIPRGVALNKVVENLGPIPLLSAYESFTNYKEGVFGESGGFTDTSTNEPIKIVDVNELITITSCEDLLNDDLRGYLKSFLKIIKVLVPIILIVLGILDFAVAIFSGKEDDMKKHANKFVKRLIIAIVIFFIPSLLQLLLTIASNIWNNIDPSLCGILD